MLTHAVISVRVVTHLRERYASACMRALGFRLGPRVVTHLTHLAHLSQCCSPAAIGAAARVGEDAARASRRVCTGTLVHWYTGTPVHRYTGKLVHWYTGTLVHWYTGTLVHWYTGTLVHWYTGTLIHR